MAKKLIIYGTIIFTENEGKPVSATVQKIEQAVLLEETYFTEVEERMGKEDWLIPHLYKGKIIWQ